MTDYNDGKWHGWNGGECPVHPKTTVECAYRDKRSSIESLAESFPWNATIYEYGGTDRPAAFRVIKEHKEPRDWWVDELRMIAVPTPHAGFIHVREVLE